MIRMVVQNRNGTIKLFGQQNAHHAVRQGQAGKTHHHVCLLFQTVGHAVCAADNKTDVFAVLLPAFQMLRQFDRSRRFAARYGARFADRAALSRRFDFAQPSVSSGIIRFECRDKKAMPPCRFNAGLNLLSDGLIFPHESFIIVSLINQHLSGEPKCPISVKTSSNSLWHKTC